MGSPQEGEHFFRERWPEARAVSDEAKELYAAFGLSRGTLGQVLGPRVLWAGLGAALRGHGLGKPVGDPLMLSGWFLVDEGAVVWSDVHAHAGASGRYEEAARAAKIRRDGRPGSEPPASRR
jgi:hypothetical protein